MTNSCPKCGNAMIEGRSETDRSGEPVRQTFTCEKCGHTEIKVITNG